MSAAELLDQLDALHAAATTGPWELDREALLASNDTGDLLFDYRDVVLVEDHSEGIAGCTADGELIVAAVNTLPQLTAALRAVLNTAEAMDRFARAEAHDPTSGSGALTAAAADLRDAIAAALSPAEPQSGNPA